ncbi:MAG: thermonuclease family protein [Pseudomonadota bacterium]
MFVSLAACSEPVVRSLSATPSQSIYWSDGDSGRLDGMKFRLANVDAPETGGVGARGGAKCESERELGFDAKAFMVDLTRDAELVITGSNGPDRYEREVITLSANGVDVAQAGIQAGHLEAWPHRGRRALADKPDWCGR